MYKFKQNLAHIYPMDFSDLFYHRSAKKSGAYDSQNNYLLWRTADNCMCLWTIQLQKTYLKFLLKLFDFHNFQVTLLIQNF